MLTSVALMFALALSPESLSDSQAAASATIGKLEVVWNQAHLHGDVESLDRLWAPELTVIVPGMQPFSKSELLKMWRSMKVVFTDYTTTDVHINVFGRTAVVTGRLHRSRNFGGRVATEEWLFTKSYAQIEDQWEVVAYHASVAPPP